MFRNGISSIFDDYVNSVRSHYYKEINNKREEEETNLRISDNAVGPMVNKVDSAHFYIKANAKLHHTDEYELIDDNNAKPILRRGQPFYLAIRFKDRSFDLKTDRILLNFRFGPRPSVTKGTMGVIEIANTSFTKSEDDWDVKIDPGTNERDLMLKVQIPVNVPVGIWKLHIQSGLQDRSESREMALFKEETDVFILFNPWHKDDAVYMDDDEKRNEYVMNDTGKVYRGSHRFPSGKPWTFGQFDDVVLPIACYILEFSNFSYAERGNPTQVVRAISAGVNANDDNGILIGNWTNDYSGGTAPTTWNGSVSILEEYMKHGYRPVKYGQCWVFSGLVTTICRALGIPCRSVTNYESAHDTDKSLTIDKYFDNDNNLVEGPQGSDGPNTDRIWNFHVWNDVWMKRPDLPLGYGGWQAIDSTPQEFSGHLMQCGPASLVAINRGDIGLGYDCAFIFSEVNADIMHWVEDFDSPWGYRRSRTIRSDVGLSLVTKKPGQYDDDGDTDVENVTGEYKNRENTPAERLAIHNAIRSNKRAQEIYGYSNDIKEDVQFDLLNIDSVQLGDAFQLKITFRNTSNEKRTVSASLHAKSVYYTGVHHSIIKKGGGLVHLKPKEEKDVKLTVSYDEYWKRLQTHCLVKIYAVGRVLETKQIWSEEDDFQLMKPQLKIKTPKRIQRMQPCELVFSFDNPLDEELTDCELSIEGAGLLRPRRIKLPENVNARGTFSFPFTFRPRIQGFRRIVVSFSSRELVDITGTKTMQVMSA